MRKRQSVVDGLTVVCSLEHNKSITWTCHLFTTHDDVDQNNHSMIWSYQSPRGAWPSCMFPRCRCFMRPAAWVQQTTRIGLLSKWAIKYWRCADDQLCNLWPRGWHQFPVSHWLSLLAFLQLLQVFRGECLWIPELRDRLLHQFL